MVYKDLDETTCFFETFRPLIEHSRHCEIVIFPPFLDVATAITASHGTRIEIGAQNLYFAEEGAFTGEVSGPMIRAAGCSHVIVGHSERRRYFGETNENVLKKTMAALDAGITPIVCIGEREKQKVDAVLMKQFHKAIGALAEGQFAKDRQAGESESDYLLNGQLESALAVSIYLQALRHCETNVSEFGNGKLPTAHAYEPRQKQECSKVTINRYFATTSMLAVSRAGWLDVVEVIGKFRVGALIRWF